LAPAFSGARVARSVLCSVFVFGLSHLANVFSVLRFTISDSSSLEPMNKLNTTMHLYSLDSMSKLNAEMYIWCLEGMDKLKAEMYIWCL
jgi:hypothetical protein